MSHHFLTSRRSAGRPAVPKICGADVELGNFVTGIESTGTTCALASQALLEEIEGIPWRAVEEERADGHGASQAVRPAESAATSRSVNPQDRGRRFLPANGGCAYIDLDHLELCLPEVRSARDHVAAWHAMLRIAREALDSANGGIPGGCAFQALVNNSDGLGHSYGGHLDLLVSRAAWENLFSRKMQYMLFLAAYQVSSIVFAGQGKVGSENHAPAVDFQISQRADFLEALTGPQTTYRRPIVNSRDEALCGTGWQTNDELARLHVIFYDSTLAPVACFLKVGVLQIILAMIEAEWVNLDLLLQDPLDAVLCYSHDPTLRARARLLSGRAVSAVELQRLFLGEAERFVETGAAVDQVPDCEEILSLWRDTLDKLQAGDLDSLASRLDWVLKRTLLEEVLRASPQLSWRSPEIKHLDQVFGSLSLSEGLYWAYERAGFVESVVSEERIRHFVENPPDDTRAWTRAFLLRRWGEHAESVDWDRIRFRALGESSEVLYRTVHMTDPAQLSRHEVERLIGDAECLEDALDLLGARWEVPPSPRSATDASRC